MNLLNRRGRAALLASTAVALGLGAPSLPSASATDACAGLGSAHVASPHEATSIATTSTGFAATLDLGGCSAHSTITLDGVLSGTCAHTVGTGRTSTGHGFTLSGSGYSFVLAGGVVGTLSLVDGDGVGSPCSPSSSLTNSTYVTEFQVALVG